ncbi:MAG: hypothetical protein J6A97_02920 [Clostridia bacterium]|nr:hypothetical protein [Clostridia bacterium]
MKKKIIITVAIICAVFLTGISAGAFLMNSSIGISTGHVLISENGTCFLIKGNSPVRLSDYSEKNNVLPELKTGDKVLVIHDGIAESYPASTLCRFCIKTGSGSISDIPEEVISSMTQLGWLGESFDGNWKELPFDAQFIRTGLPVPAPGGTLLFPQYDIIKTYDEMEGYRKLTLNGINEDFIKATEKYTEDFFTDNLLFIAHLEEGSGSNTHKVTKVTGTEKETNIYIETIEPEVGTCDMAYHRIVVELKKSDTENTDFQLFFNGVKTANNWKDVKIAEENANIFLSLPEDWEYTETGNEPDSETNRSGITFYHSSDPENNITIEFTDAFGVCGTGLRTEEIRINSYNASMGIYDSCPTFSYIVFENTPGFYVIYNNADAPWWQKYEDDVRAIFSTLRIAEGIVFREEALSIAEKYAVGENKKQYGEFDSASGIWSFVFETDEASQTIKIDKNGNKV